MRMTAVLDVGGTAIKSGLIDAALLAAGPDQALEAVTIGPSVPTRSTEDTDTVLGQLAQAVREAIGLGPGDVGAVAIAFPGPFDVTRGVAMIRGLHKFESIFGVELRPALTARIGRGDMAIEFARDSEAAGVGEAVFGAGRPSRRVLTVTLGTGLGACLTDHGAVVERVGDLDIERLAQRTTETGRADDVLSARGLADRLGVATDGLRSRIDQGLIDDALADHGDRLGAFLRPVVAELDVDRVVVGGGLVAAFDRYGPALQTALGTTPCAPAQLGAAGPLLGAVRLTGG